jgi:hypothetical protein
VAWLAERRWDAASQHRALERILAAGPGDGAAPDRMAELALRAGQPARDDRRASLARLGYSGTAGVEPGRALAEVLALELEAAAAPRPRPTPSPAQGTSSAPIQL